MARTAELHIGQLVSIDFTLVIGSLLMLLVYTKLLGVIKRVLAQRIDLKPSILNQLSQYMHLDDKNVNFYALVTLQNPYSQLRALQKMAYKL